MWRAGCGCDGCAGDGEDVELARGFTDGKQMLAAIPVGHIDIVISQQAGEGSDGLAPLKWKTCSPAVPFTASSLPSGDMARPTGIYGIQSGRFASRGPLWGTIPVESGYGKDHLLSNGD